MDSRSQPQDGALPFSDVTGLLAAAAGAEKQQTLVARIFVPPPSDPASSSLVDHFARLSSFASQLRAFVEEYTKASSYLEGQDYIWHREPPSITVFCPPASSRASASRLSTQLPPHVLFHLRTGGECIEDEWFATRLLILASTHFAKHRPCINVEDEDGQFLLIEAADYLPEWITPEAVTNRVWIFDGHLHLIPPHHRECDEDHLAASRAVELVTDSSILTRASDDIEAAAFARAFEFPSAAKTHQHRTLAYLPSRIAKVLAAEPQLIANCVISIQSRDIVSSRSGSRLVHFPPPSPSSSGPASTGDTIADSDNAVGLYSVCMTRHLYAQLLYDRFFPPRQLGSKWQAAVEKYRLRLHGQPSASSAQTKVEDEAQVQQELQQGRWHDLGAKIWCGLEMAYTESLSRRTRTTARPMAATENALSAHERAMLVESLNKLGYFSGEMEGSAKWKQLEATAVTQYLRQSSVENDGNKSVSENTLLCDGVDRILQRPSAETTRLAPFDSDAASEVIRGAEDDDSWLQLGADDIEIILQGKAGDSKDGAARAIDEQDTFQRLGAFNSKMEAFVKTRSDVRGAVFEHELDAEDMQVDDDDLLFENLDEDEQEENIRREVQERMRLGGEEAKRKLVERLIPRMSEQEWTRKPKLGTDPQSSVDKTAKDSRDFLSSIDRIAAERQPAAVPQKPETRDVAMREHNNLSAAHAELRRRLASQYMRETSTLLSSQGHHQFDGASDSDDEELEQETSPEVRRQRAQEYDIEPDDVDTAPGEAMAEADWEDLGEPAELDEETEVGNLLEFARISLGLTKEQYQEILEERKDKGKFVPAARPTKDPQPKTGSTTEASTGPTPAPKLDTFESVMAAMESQLHHLRSTAEPSPSTASSSSKPRSTASKQSTSSEEEDQELLAHLLKSGLDLPSSLLSHLGEDAASGIQAEQMEAFLRSFQAQAATSGPRSGSGPVDVLMRRFGLGGLPADQDAPSSQ